jgi:hypothetical protein
MLVVIDSVSDAIRQIVDRLGQSKDREYSLDVASENDGMPLLSNVTLSIITATVLVAPIDRLTLHCSEPRHTTRS